MSTLGLETARTLRVIVPVGGTPTAAQELELVAGSGVTLTGTRTGNRIELEVSASGGGGGAPTGAEYVVLSANGSLSNERVLTEGTGIVLTDAGAGSTLTVAVDAGLASLTAADASAGLPYVTGANTWATATLGDLAVSGGAWTVTDLTITSEAHGDLLYRAAGAWQRLAPSTADYVLTTQGAGAAPVWKSLPTLATPTQTISADTTLTTQPALLNVTGSYKVTLLAVSAMTIGRPIRVVYRGTTAATIEIIADAADLIEAAGRVALYGHDIVADVIPFAANKIALVVHRGLGMWTHADYDLTTAAGASPWTIGGATFTDISSASNSVSASSGLAFSSISVAYYGSGLGAVVKTPLSGVVDAWSRPLTSEDSFWMLVRQQRTSGSGTNAQPGVVLATATISGTPKAGWNMEGSAGDLQANIRTTATSLQEDATPTYLTAEHWLGGQWHGRLKELRNGLLTTSPSGLPGAASGWWPTAHLNAVRVTNGEGLSGQMLDVAAFTDLHLTQTGATDQITMNRFVIVRAMYGAMGG